VGKASATLRACCRSGAMRKHRTRILEVKSGASQSRDSGFKAFGLAPE
jgi:hypothetical protein